MKYCCPCCGYKTMEHKESEYHDICPGCYWENDPIQNEDEEYAGGSNLISLKVARENFLFLGAVSKDVIDFVRPPYEDEK